MDEDYGYACVLWWVPGRVSLPCVCCGEIWARVSDVGLGISFGAGRNGGGVRGVRRLAIVD